MGVTTPPGQLRSSIYYSPPPQPPPPKPPEPPPPPNSPPQPTPSSSDLSICPIAVDEILRSKPINHPNM